MRLCDKSPNAELSIKSDLTTFAVSWFSHGCEKHHLGDAILMMQGSEASSCGGLMLRSIPNIIAAVEHLLSSNNRGGGGEYQQQQRRGRARPEEGQHGEEDPGLGGEVEQGQRGDEDPGPEQRRRPSAATASKIVRGDGGQGGPNRGPSRRFTASWHDSEGGDKEEEL
ncbi:uncharacterized protein [Triticum aestivum]|uniref:uncharacterized protein isoform X2 n=1 Tax=Triticum aestivum TaxID=4565 RepID=UPI001D034E14|nr:uncharacterized protein LOC123072666 isoform X2 [Triticum aestivum]